ncbi:MAG TPA: glycosyltransferase family 39 protein [Patescibacteria group bacterium]|nr:glycosyltransferase family 39 protein [Patescibacteria group bacterium]
MNKLKLVALFFIFILAAVLRFYKIDKVPASLNWDEVAAGYNAYTIANWGADEYGKKFPIVFKNFGDDKHPVHIYITAAVVKIFGFSDYSTRAGSALVGMLMVVAIYFLAKEIFKSELAGILSSLFFAVSPYAIHFSRGLWEANFALFFMVAGVTAFYLGLRKQNFLIPLSFLFWGLSFFSYHSAKIVVPPLVLFLLVTHFKEFIINKKNLLWAILITIFFAGLIIKEPRILGFARINQTRFPEEVTQKYGGEFGTIAHNYKDYFTYSYLFEKGDQTPRGSVKVIGEFYRIDFILSLVGLSVLFVKKKWEVLTILFSWLLLAPIPGAVSSVDPGATRGIFMLAPILLLSAYGATSIVQMLKQNWAKYLSIVVILIFLGWEALNFINYYFNTYPVKDAIEWQYGMKDSVAYAQKHSDYSLVYMDKIRQQPYIFFLYYLKVPLPELLRSVKYDQTISSSYNTVSSFGKYNFGNWDPIESYPSADILYIITPSFYSGLRYISSFVVRKLVKYPDGTDAFYLVSGK